MKVVRRVLFALILLPLVILAAVILLALTMDPNRLKPVLENTLAQHNVGLDIQGDIRWRFYPNLGISLQQLTLTALEENGHRPLASGATASASVQLFPLLRRQIIVDGIYLEGAMVTYAIDSEGNSNWDALLGEPREEVPELEPEASDGSPPELAIKEIQLNGLSLRYSNAQTDDHLELNNINFISQNLALDGQSFPINLSLLALYQDLPPLQVQFSGPMGVNLETQTLNLNKGELKLSSSGAQALLQLSSTTSWDAELTSRGMLLLEPMELKPWLEAFGVEAPADMADEALKQVGFSTPYDFGPDHFYLPSVQIQLDSTEISGNLEVHDFEQPQITSHWRGTTLNVDHYLPPADEEEAPPTENAEPQPLPLEALRELALEFSVQFERIIMQRLPLEEPSLALTARSGLITIDRLNTRVAGGQINGTGQFDARADTAQLQLNIDGQGIGIGELLQTFADLDFVSGSAALDLAITSQGATDQELTDNLRIEAQAQSQELRLTPFNLEQQFCRALAVLQQSTPPEFDWPQMTRMEPVTLKARFAEQTLTLENLTAEVADLEAGAAGHLDLASGVFDFPFKLSLGDFAGEIPGCLPIQQQWRKRALPLRCKGSLDSIGARTCLPDTQLLTAMLRDRVEGELRERVDAGKAELQQRAEERAQQLRESERGTQVEERARGLLDQVRPRR